MNPEHRGHLLATASAVGAGAFVIPFKLASTEGLSPLTVAWGLLLCGSVFNLLATLSSGGGRVRPTRLVWGLSAALMVFTVVGNVAAARAVSVLEPAIFSSVIQTQVLFGGLFGWLFLREPVTRRFAVGVALALCGIALMRLTTVESHAVPVVGVVLVAFAAASFTMIHVLTRKYVARVVLIQLNAVRLWFSVAALALVPGVLAEAWSAPPHFWGAVAVAAFLGPFLARIAAMHSARFIPAARGILIATASPVVALTLGWALLDTLPERVQLLGAALLLAGVLVPVLGAARAATPVRPASE